MGERATEEKAERRRRRGDTVLSGLKLSVNEDTLDRKNYEYRWINDDGGRIDHMTQSDDWDLIKDPSKIGKPDADGLGTVVSKIVGRNASGPMRAYMARKPRKFYEEDQRAKAASIEQTMDAIRRGAPQTEAGSLGSNGYVPGGPTGISIKSSR